LDLSRMEAGRLELQRTAVPIAGELDWVCSLFGPQAAERGIELEATAAPNLPPVLWLDEGRFRQIIMNLIGNALKYTKRQSHARIAISARHEGSEYVFSIADNGVGFDMRYADKLFEVFQRLHPASEFSGTGVGLAIVRRAIERHGGRCWAESEVGRGAVFFFALPLDPHA